MKIELSSEQEKAVDAAANWYAARGIGVEPFKIFGPAGVGKSTVAGQLPEALGIPRHAIAYGTYTGKAAHVLNRKGVPATTIHSAIYRPVGSDPELREKRDQLQAAINALMLELNPPMDKVAGIEIELAEVKKQMNASKRFELNPLAEWAGMELIVLDEVSMVDERMARDIESFGVPVLVLGDPAQLPPIGGAGHYTKTEPDVLLTEVHRQALDSPVLAMATRIRLGQGFRPGERVRVSLAEAMRADQVLVWKNSTRWKLIESMRREMGRPAGKVVAGDRIICLSNNRDIAVLNGMQFEVLAAEDCGSMWALRLLDDDGRERELMAFAEGFRGQKGEEELKGLPTWRGEVMAATFANVITVHKSQGSEWDHVYFVDQSGEMRSASEGRRLAYTAITRARERIIVAAVGVR